MGRFYCRTFLSRQPSICMKTQTVKRMRRTMKKRRRTKKKKEKKEANKKGP